MKAKMHAFCDLKGALVSLLIAVLGSHCVAQEVDGSPPIDTFKLNDTTTVLPSRLTFLNSGESTVSTQLLSRQAIDGTVGYAWNITFQYLFDVPVDEEIAAFVESEKWSLPQTVEFRTYVSANIEGQSAGFLVDSGTTNLRGILASSFDLEFVNSKELTDFIASGAIVNVVTVIKFAQITSVVPDTDQIRQIIVDYLGNNVVSPKAPVLETYSQLRTEYPDVVGRNPVLVLSSIASVFEASSIEIDLSGEPRLVIPPAFEININATFSAPRNLRFSDQSFAIGAINLCEDGDLVILELGTTGCENVPDLIDRFE
ncbi:hypothetical protein [Primorskyibacter sp. 2E233]|uniref:hypothetical protein n=1 Tax=Primorskyibacter sp. 2E233 TaxID=3413431 RepID=UPI003BF069E1